MVESTSTVWNTPCHRHKNIPLLFFQLRRLSQRRHILRRYKPMALWLASIRRECQLKVIPKGELKAKPTKRDDDDNTVHTTLHWQTVPSPGVTNVCPRTRQKAAVSRRCDYSFFLAMSQHAAQTFFRVPHSKSN